MKDHGLILYDGYCNLCSRAVQWIVRNDTRGRFSFEPLEDPGLLNPGLQDAGQEGAGPGDDTVVLLMNGNRYERSTAVLKIAVRLRFPWPVLAILFIVPSFIRDWVYRVVAGKRGQWFGLRSSCYIPGKPD